MDIFNQKAIDEALIKLDGTKNKSSLGANASLGVSIACAKAAAKAKGLSTYEYLSYSNNYSMVYPTMNVINGGVHALNTLDIQELMIVPKSAETISEAIHMWVNVFNTLKLLLYNILQNPSKSV